MFDIRHKDAPPDFQKNASDPNAYSWGSIGKHNVVLASLPAGEYGLISAATMAQGLRSSLPHTRVGIIVGIGAGVPGEQPGKDGQPTVLRDIRLGDVAVSMPDSTNGGVVQFDLVKAKRAGDEEVTERKGFLNSPPTAVRTALSKLQASHELDDSTIPDLIEQAFQRYKKMRTKYSHPGIATQGNIGARDVYHTRDGTEIVQEARTIPEVHYGTIASSNTLEKSATHRDKVLTQLKKEGIQPICFETEAAGLMNSFPCLVIRGICDYADEYKNDHWQRYAAATAAAFAKEFLSCVDADEVQRTQKIGELFQKLKRG
ncbi:hypothetical protein LTR49_025826 [Elasticomyces elasticus]|nr:hypothetical protein LTR49_025826 [Elasticomyces elasticus]KAK5734473.1 hypothetical protein LTS12_026698 [Elasticomyces elasticus]